MWKHGVNLLFKYYKAIAYTDQANTSTPRDTADRKVADLHEVWIPNLLRVCRASDKRDVDRTSDELVGVGRPHGEGANTRLRAVGRRDLPQQVHLVRARVRARARARARARGRGRGRCRGRGRARGRARGRVGVRVRVSHSKVIAAPP